MVLKRAWAGVLDVKFGSASLLWRTGCGLISLLWEELVEVKSEWAGRWKDFVRFQARVSIETARLETHDAVIGRYFLVE